MACSKYIAALVLGVFAFSVLPGVHAAKPPKPIDELENRVTDLESDVATLNAEVAGLSEQVNLLTQDIAVIPRPVQVYADGQPIGPLLFGLSGTLKAYTTWSAAGYIFRICPLAFTPAFCTSDAQLVFANFHFEQLDCIGQPYISLNDNVVAPKSEGQVFHTPDPADPVRHYYRPKQVVAVTRTLMSRFFSQTGCVKHEPPFVTDTTEALPNDPAITGVPNEPFAPPITLGQ